MNTLSYHTSLTSPICWFGGDCKNLANYLITHGYSAFGPETHPICKSHLKPMINSCLRPLTGWGRALPITIINIDGTDLIYNPSEPTIVYAVNLTSTIHNTSVCLKVTNTSYRGNHVPCVYTTQFFAARLDLCDYHRANPYVLGKCPRCNDIVDIQLVSSNPDPMMCTRGLGPVVKSHIIVNVSKGPFAMVNVTQ